VDEKGDEVPPGTVGLLAVRGPTGCRYLDDPDRQQQYVRDGWNYPGDAYLVDEDGFFHYQSRADDMIITSGYNVSGLQVESTLLLHEAVAECGVIGVPDDERGHLVKAFVVVREGVEAGEALAKELQDFVKAQIAPYKYPRAVQFLEALPRTQTGKLQRFRLRDL
jgi:2-aminobenzoate-CoA ligase